MRSEHAADDQLVASHSLARGDPAAVQTWSEVELAYAAGVLDSDGAISTLTARSVDRSGRQRTRFIEYASVGQVDPGAVRFFKDTFGGARFIRPPERQGDLPLFFWRITHGRAVAFLRAALPYLRIKRRQAELCVAMRRLKDALGPRDETDLDLARIRSEMLELNQVEGRAERKARAAASVADVGTEPPTAFVAAGRSVISAYAAGVIDSDGSIRIHRDTYAMRVLKNTLQATFSECVTIRQLEHEAIDIIHARFGGSRGVAVQKHGDSKRQPLQVVQLVDRRAFQLVTATLPYLRIKRPQAELCLELRRLKDESRRARFAPGRGHRGAGRRPEWITEAMEALYLRMLQLNRRVGTSESWWGGGSPGG